jgi:phospholipid/cholesterol/gamma-HCH transport system substrate-binding protein
METLAREVRSGKGTLGKLVTDESLYKNAQALVTEVRGISGSIQQGSGTMGRLINDPEIYYEARRAIRNMNKTAEDVSEATPISTLAIILGSVFR